MRRLLVLTCSALLFASPLASAQLVNITLGVGASRQGPLLCAGLTLQNVALAGGFGLDARLLADLGRGGGLDVSGFVEGPLNRISERLTLYGGPGLSVGRGLHLGATAGLAYQAGGQAGVFTEASYQWARPLRWRAGLTYAF